MKLGFTGTQYGMTPMQFMRRRCTDAIHASSMHRGPFEMGCMTDERSLFDSTDEPHGHEAGEGASATSVSASSVESTGETETGMQPTDSPWRECPLDVFLAMSEVEQLDYCARRDEDSALYASTEKDAEWYLQRSMWYRAEIKRLKR